MVNHKQP